VQRFDLASDVKLAALFGDFAGSGAVGLFGRDSPLTA
jgi:hypothetical protein